MACQPNKVGPYIGSDPKQGRTLKLEFNPIFSTIMHLDLNSCFATIEQQANPLLRGKPVAVAAYTTSSGCIVAPSIEAKRYGVKTGMRVKEAKLLCSDLIVVSPDPAKYRNVHLALKRLLSDYTDDFSPKSIDEFVLNLEHYIDLNHCSMSDVGRRIKERIRKEIGEWLSVSVGIASNRFLAKTAAGLHKPDGLDEINKNNYLDIYTSLKLIDLCGIKERNAARLNGMGIYNVLDFANAPIWKLKAAFNSIAGYYWYIRLHGYEVDEVIFSRRSYGNSFALPAGRQVFQTPEELSPILSKLVVKMGARLRRAGYKAQGVHLAISYRDGSFWHHGAATPKVLFDSRDFFKEALKIVIDCPYRKPVRNLAVSVFNLTKANESQLELFDDILKKEKLVSAIDKINNRWGNFVITPARMAGTNNVAIDRIAFGA